MKNIIFQYMITDDETEDRNPVPQYPQGTRTELYRKTADLSAQSFRIYADKIGAAHHYSTHRVETKGKHGSTSLLFEVMRLVYDPIYDEYDKLLFADSDIICNTEENIFNLLDTDVYGVFESDIKTSKGGGYNTWDFSSTTYKKISDKFTRRGIPVVKNKWGDTPSRVTCFNTGVMVWSRDARLRAREVFDDWYNYMIDGDMHKEEFWLNNDQLYISGQLTKHKFAIEGIDQTWNDTPTHWDDDRGYDMNFLHYTGGGNKVIMLEDYKNNKFKYLKNA
tara:strand:- start:4958 stop:5791 length:834 start_codon:yes stop_codon:yes gene_type:complete